MVQATISGYRNLSKDIQEAIEEKKSEVLKEKAYDFALDLIALTPTYTSGARFSIGAYANSFSFKINNTRSRGRRLKGSTSISDARSRLASGQVYDAQAGFEKLLSDVKNADYSDVKTMTFRNDSDHAREVEGGGVNWKRRGYKVFSQARARNS